LARESVDGFLTRVSDSPQLRSAGLEKLRQALLAQAQEFYDRLAKERGEDAGLQTERGRAYLRLAAITAQLGQRVAAAENALQARDVFDGLARQYPEVAGYRDSLAEAQETASRCLLSINQLDKSRALLEQAVALRERLVAEHPEAPAYRLGLAKVCLRSGMFSISGDWRPTEAEAALLRALKLFEPFASEQPESTEARKGRAETLMQIGRLRGLQKMPKEAEVRHREAVAQYEELVASRPGDPVYEQSLCVALTNAATECINVRNVDRAKADFERVKSISERLFRQHPDVPVFREQFVNARIGLAVCEAKLGRHAVAATEVESALAIPSPTGFVLANAASTLAQCSAAAKRDMGLSETEREKLTERYAARAVGLLKEAYDYGFFGWRAAVEENEQDPDLEPLRDRDDFRKLMRKLKEGAR
jgi:tetratricopeptide (TPR) repeat protein